MRTIRFGSFAWQVPRRRNVYAKMVRLCASRRVGPLWVHREKHRGRPVFRQDWWRAAPGETHAPRLPWCWWKKFFSLLRSNNVGGVRQSSIRLLPSRAGSFRKPFASQGDAALDFPPWRLARQLPRYESPTQAIREQFTIGLLSVLRSPSCSQLRLSGTLRGRHAAQE